MLLVHSILGQGSTSDSGVFAFVFLVIWLGLAFWCSSIWSKKGGSGGVGFLLGLILGVIGLIIVAVATPSKSASVTAAPAASAAITWTHTGFRYLMGYTVNPPTYGIWDREAPGPPMIRFPYSEHGKNEALAKFRELEPTGAEVSLLPSPPPQPPSG